MALLLRQKVLLKVLNALQKKGFNVKNLNTYLVKTLFLLRQEYNASQYITFYNFYPYKFGPFSQLIYSDLRSLERNGLLQNDQHQLTIDGNDVVNLAHFPFDNGITEILSRFESQKKIVDYVYEKYPSYTVKSLIAKNKTKHNAPAALFTIGYEGKDIDLFLNILIENGIDVLVDVRNNPFSMNFSFIQSKLQKYLENVGISYTHYPSLGIEGEKRKEAKTKEDFANLFSKYKIEIITNRTHEVNEILLLAKTKRICLLCFEHNHLDCHRGVLSNVLSESNINVTHLGE